MNMAADGAALVEARAGVTFGVELYVFGGRRALKEHSGCHRTGRSS